MRISWKYPAIAFAAALMLVAPGASAWVGGGVVIGAPVYYPAPAPYYYPAPYYPSPTPYPAAPQYPPQAMGPPGAAAYGENQGEDCREYSRRAVIAGENQEIFGHACRQPDGKWHIVD